LVVHWLRNWAAPCLAALGLLFPSSAISYGQTLLGHGLGLQKCFYRVYYRVEGESAWQCYATYTDLPTAQRAVNYLHGMGCGAYLR
jgi:hypothetical protein